MENNGGVKSDSAEAPKYNEVAEFYEESHLGWETDHAELTKLTQKTPYPTVGKVATYIDQNSTTIEKLSPRGEPGVLTNGDLKLLRNLSKVNTAVDTAAYIKVAFGPLDHNGNGKIGKREVQWFVNRNRGTAAGVTGEEILDGFDILAKASGKAGGSIDARDVAALHDPARVDDLMRKEYKSTEFIRRSAPVSLTVGGAFAALAAIGENDDQREKQRSVEAMFKLGTAVGKLLAYPIFNKSIENYYQSTARESIGKLFR